MIVVPIVFVLLSMIVFSVAAERFSFGSNYSNWSRFSRLSTVSSEGIVEVQDVDLPQEANTYRSAGPLYFEGIASNPISVPAGYYAIFEIRSYFTQYSGNASYVAVPVSQRIQFLKTSLLSDFTVDEYQLYASNDADSSSQLGLTYSTVVFQNTSTSTGSISGFRFGVNGKNLNSSLLRYWLKLDYIHYRVISAVEYNQMVVNGQTADIVSGMQEQTDEIVNGWEYSETDVPGSDSFDDLDSLDGELLDSSSDALDESKSLIGNIGTHLTTFSSGFVVFINIFNSILNIGFLYDLILIGLALGVIAFLLNIIPSISSKLTRQRNSFRNDVRKFARRGRNRKDK